MNWSLALLVLRFSRRMLAKLQANAHKPGWQDDDPRVLLRRLDQEVGELRRAIHAAATIEEIEDPRGRWSRRASDGSTVTFRLGAVTRIDPAALGAISNEAADVANFALIVADRCGALAASAEAAE